MSERDRTSGSAGAPLISVDGVFLSSDPDRFTYYPGPLLSLSVNESGALPINDMVVLWSMVCDGGFIIFGL